MRTTTENPTTLAVDKELHSQVRAKAKQLRMTTLELTDSLIRFALKNCEVEKQEPIVKLKQQLLPV